MDEKDTLFKDREPPKTIPYPAAPTHIAYIGEYPPPPGGTGSL